MNIDREMAEWQAEWIKTEAIHLPDLLKGNLHEFVERKTRRMRLDFAGQLLWGGALLAFSAWFASRHPSFEWILWASVIWTATFIAVGFTLWNKAGTWKALQQSNAAFLDLSNRRCRRELQAIYVGRWALAAQLGIVTVWLSIDALTHRLPLPQYLFGMTLTMLIGAIWLIIFHSRERRVVRDIENLRALLA